jgi:hypothetical protein
MKFSIFISFLLAFISAVAQNKPEKDSLPSSWKLKARILDYNTQAPLYGAHVINLNTVLGSVTDKQGMFLIPVSVQDTLHISFLGYQSKKIPITADMKEKDLPVFLLHEKYTDLETVTLEKKLTGVLSVDTKIAPDINDNHRHLNGLPQTFETGAPKPKQYNNPSDLIFHPVDFLYEMFGKKPKELRKLRKLQQEDNLREILEKKANREVLMEYLNMDIEQLNNLLNYCNYSDYFIKYASDLQVIEAVLECYENYKALKEGTLHKR